MIARAAGAGVAGTLRQQARTTLQGIDSSTDRRFAEATRLLDSDPSAAVERARNILRTEPAHGDSLRLLAAALRRLERYDEAQQAEMEAISASALIPDLVQAAEALAEGRQARAEDLLLPYLRRHPTDGAAIVMLAEIGFRIGAYGRCEAFLRNVLSRAPAYARARLVLARLQLAQARLAEASETLDGFGRQDPVDAEALMMKAAVLEQLGDYERSAALQEALLRREPRSAALWVGYAHKLRTMGRPAEAATAYRNALGIERSFGDAWWGLADLGTLSFDKGDVRAMTEALEADRPGRNDAPQLHFALAKAHEDEGRIEDSFRHLAEGNRLKRASFDYDPRTLTDEIGRAIDLFTPAFFSGRRDWGCPAPDPIFVLGMPRSGSTLVEQILASHSMVEGTSELPHIPALVNRLAGEEGSQGLPYPELLARLDKSRLASLGEEYLERARLHRKSRRPFFIDKMPHNWTDIGFILLILPNARIIDVRRHPLSCCLSNFKRYFAKGHPAAFSLDEMGRYYRDYVRLLGHMDEAVPGRIRRVFHEALVEDSEAGIRGLLDQAGLPFEEACLRFHENERAVRTPSAEQVRRPIRRDNLEPWRPYEPWLGPLKAALGPVLEGYPDLPERWTR